MVRVLQCVVGMNYGGIETMLMNTFRCINRDKLQFDFLVSLDGAYDTEIKELGGNVFKIPFIDKVGPFQYAKNLQSFFKNHPQYNIIHTHMDKFGGFLLREGYNCNIPNRIAHSHNTNSEGNFIIRSVKDYYGRMVCKYATHLFACGNDAANWMYGSNAKDAQIIKNGIDLNKFMPVDLRDKQRFTVGNVARFSPTKNHDFLIDIMYELRKKDASAYLVLIGDGANLQKIKDKVNKLSLDSNVLFVGSTRDVNKHYQSMDVLCMPSLFEGFPVSLLEAQSTGTPCLVSDVVDKECNVTGLVTLNSLASSPEEWADALLMNKGNDKVDKRDALEKAGYSAELNARILEEYYLSL